MSHIKRLRLRLLLALPLFTGCAEDADLSKALFLDGSRELSSPIPAVEMDWVDFLEIDSDASGLLPVSVCLGNGFAVIADGRNQQLIFTDANGRILKNVGSRGVAPGAFAAISSVHCSDQADEVLVVDSGLKRVTFLDSAGQVLRTLDAPMSPQIGIVGDYAVASDGRWFESWLGTRIPLGPYLTEDEWEAVPLATARDSTGDVVARIGTPTAYSNTVATRVFNATSLAIVGDTIWVLTRGDASLRGYAFDGEPVAVVRLPVYFRGKESSIKVGSPGPASHFRSNEMTYHPNVHDISVGAEGGLLVARYRNWRLRLVGRGITRTLMHYAESAIEVVDEDGTVRSAYGVPGMVTELASDRTGTVAVVTLFPDRTLHLLFGRIPCLRCSDK